MTVLSVRQEPTRPGHQNRVTIHYLTLKTLKWSAGDLIVLPATGDAPESVWKVWPSLQGDKETITFATALDTLPETLDTSTARRVLSSSTAAAKAPTSSVVCRVSGDDAKVVADVTEDVLTLWKEILCELCIVDTRRPLRMPVYRNKAERITISLESNDVLVKVDRTTTLSFGTQVVTSTSAEAAHHVAGLEKELKSIHALVAGRLSHRETYRQLGLDAPKGILLYGPPGTGKTMIARSLAQQNQCTFITVSAAEIIDQYLGASEAKLKNIFASAREQAPAIIFFDELDALCPKRDETSSETSNRIVALLLTSLDALDVDFAPVVVIAATNRPNTLDPALRRPGRFDREVEIPIPNELARSAVLKELLRTLPHTLTADQTETIVQNTHGFVGADIKGLLRQAASHAMDRQATTEEAMHITFEDITMALKTVLPSTMKELHISIPHVSWQDIGGGEAVKEALVQSIQWPIKHADAFKRLGIKAPKGVLLYGPPGCSKTMMAKALASESGLNFISIKSPEIFDKYVGESERKIRELFKKARAASPSIIFLDEIDALAPSRQEGGSSSVSERVLTSLLTEMDGVEPLNNVSIVAATNRPDVLDPALLRPGRFDRLLYIPLPNQAARLHILQIQARKMPFAREEEDDPVHLLAIAEQTENYSGAELVAICQEAAFASLTESMTHTKIHGRHLLVALAKVKPQTPASTIAFFKAFQSK